ncbi:S-layer homology domain-containing protein [Sporosarcina cyprini]|uniref:S-layer homology domain-containing protein n=1 Tax=Sporosarcina cyprini TaxID=2910523 RepID=UPI001EE12AB9|nr:S-layer homology domain-containing protein [Sporosarcina cyprini]MCG3087508.1 S-layer homology domain-containing protein [Sporosarcina cyprini]
MNNQPKKYRNFIAGAASAALIASAVAPVVASAADKSFPDIKGNTHEEAINALVAQGIIGGYPDGTFKANKTLTRSDVVKMMGKWLEKMGYEVPKDYKTNMRFKDLTPKTNDELLKSAALVKDYGVFGGYEDGTLGAGKNITRENMAVVLVRAYDAVYKTDLVSLVKEKEFNKDVTDLAKAKAEARPYIDVLDYFDITNPKAPEFNPKNTTTRGQFATFLYKTSTLEVVADEDKEAPKLAYNGEKTLNVEYGAAFTAPTVTATDNVDEKVEVTSVITNEAGERLTAIDTKVPGTYKVTYSAIDKAGNNAEELVVTVVVGENPELEVVSVAAINATQVQVKFNNAVDKSSLFETNGDFKTANLSLTSIDGGANPTISSATLSEDGKTLLLTLDQPVSKRYKVVIENVKSKSGVALKKYDEIVDFAADKTAPFVVGTEQISATKVKIKFSEPMKAADGTLEYADGKTVTGATAKLTAGATEVIVDLSDAGVEVNKTINVKFIGLQDMAGNIIAPNPTVVQIVKQQPDGVKPSVSSVVQTGAKTFNVTFTKELDSLDKSLVTVSGGYTVQSVDKVSGTEYKVTVDTNLTGVQNVNVAAGYKDLSGQAGEAITKVVTFKEDTAVPQVVGTSVVSENGKEYLEITFDKDVTLSGSPTVTAKGSYVSSNVTHDITGQAVALESTKNTKAVRVELSKLLGTDDVKNASYNVALTFAGVASQAGVSVDKANNIKFNRGEDSATTTEKIKVTDNGIVQSATDNNIVTVTFDKNVDAATATTASNYKIDGATVESATVKSTNLKQVELKLAPGSANFSGLRNVTIQNIKAQNSTVAMDVYQGSITLNENVAPTVQSAVLTGNDTITLTFSENVTVDENAFEVFVGNDKNPLAGVTVAAVNTAAKTAVIKLGTPVTDEQLSSGLTVKLADTKNVLDTVKNPLQLTSIKVSR